MLQPELNLEEPGLRAFPGAIPSVVPRGLAVSVLLFVSTLVTTTVFGSAVYDSFARNRALNIDAIAGSYIKLSRLDISLLYGLEFSAPLLSILLAHELGHWLECQRRRVDASLPYFLPSPSLFGTFGAFIKIRSPIYSRSGLFDIGFRGPLMGFLVLIPFLLAGVTLSKSLAHASQPDALEFGVPIAIRALEWVRFPGVETSRILLHPTALAAWAGLFATALNLLPIGQLDGGHLVYSLGGELWHRRTTYGFLGALVLAGFFYWAWWAWAAIMFFFGRRHPLVFDSNALNRSRVRQFWFAALMFAISLTVIPVRSL